MNAPSDDHDAWDACPPHMAWREGESNQRFSVCVRAIVSNRLAGCRYDQNIFFGCPLYPRADLFRPFHIRRVSIHAYDVNFTLRHGLHVAPRKRPFRGRSR